MTVFCTSRIALNQKHMRSSPALSLSLCFVWTTAFTMGDVCMIVTLPVMTGVLFTWSLWLCVSLVLIHCLLSMLMPNSYVMDGLRNILHYVTDGSFICVKKKRFPSNHSPPQSLSNPARRPRGSGSCCYTFQFRHNLIWEPTVITHRMGCREIHFFLDHSCATTVILIEVSDLN